MTKDIKAKELGSELILYDTERDDVHVLNVTAQLIYNLYKEGKDITEIEQGVKNNFQFEEDQDISEHVNKCLDELEKKGLIT